MNYATQHHSGNYQTARKATTKAAAPSVRRICAMDAKTKRCSRNPKGQTQVCTDNTTADGFLKSVFLPKLEVKQCLQHIPDTTKREKDFYQSLSMLSRHYGIDPIPTQQYDYPYNFTLALWDVQRRLKQKSNHTGKIEWIQEKKKWFLSSTEQYDTGMSFYYIPIAPLFQMLKQKQRKKTAQLLLSVFAYLYHIADVPYYKQEDSYIHYLYEMLSEWIEQDDDTETKAILKNELRQAEWIGEYMEQKCFNRSNLAVFKERLDRFKIRDEYDHDCWKLAAKIFDLYSQYPQERMYRNAGRMIAYSEGHGYDEIIEMEKYISFIADTKGLLYENLSECINNEFNEYGAIEEPTIKKNFDGKPITNNNFDFETRFFSLLDDVCYLLNNYKHIIQ